MANVILALLIIFLHAYWILYALCTYDWNNFEKDQEQAKKDLF